MLNDALYIVIYIFIERMWSLCAIDESQLKLSNWININWKFATLKNHNNKTKIKDTVIKEFIKEYNKFNECKFNRIFYQFLY